MDDLISRQAAIMHFVRVSKDYECRMFELKEVTHELWQIPTAESTLRERALMLLLNWAVECDFGYDNFPEQYERYKDEVENMSYIDGMIYIAEKEVERNEKRHDL